VRAFVVDTIMNLVTCSIVFLSLVSTCFADLRIGAFNVQVFGKSKVGRADVFNILVQVSDCLLYDA